MRGKAGKRKERGAPALTVGKRNKRYGAIVNFVWREIEGSDLPFHKARPMAFDAAATKFNKDVRSIQRYWKPYDAVFRFTKNAQRQEARLAERLERFADQIASDHARLAERLERFADQIASDHERLTRAVERITTTK